jgi:competence protein ComEC
LIYALLAAAIWWANQSQDNKEPMPHFRLPAIGSPGTRLWVGGMGIVTLLIWLAVGTLPDGRLHVTFLDVGQGDAILVTLPDGRQMLIDGGPSATDLNWRLGREMPFWDRSLDVVVNTHPDADHLGGLVSILERYQVQQILISDSSAESELYEEWENRLAEKELVPVVGQTGMQLSFGHGVTATILSPGPPTVGVDDANNHSVVLHLQMEQISFLLPGDIESPVERNLVLDHAPLAATVLKSPHHGSKTSSDEMFLDAVDPQIVVISVGEENRFGHPSGDVLARYEARGLTVLRTDEQGAIEFSTDGRQLWVETTQ